MKINFDADLTKTLTSLDKVFKAKSRAVNRALKVGAMDLVRTLKRNVKLNQTRGRAYRRGGVVHYASRRGAFPNTDTGFLSQSIQLSRKTSPDAVFVVVGARYGKALEFGRRRMAARPFVRPTIKQTERRIRLRIMRAINA